jgi:oligopeptide/dipeptide ABC transporter ATP-binding protein
LVADDLGAAEGRQSLAPEVSGPADGATRTIERGSSGDFIDIDELTIDFVSIDGRVRILNGVSLNAKRGEVVGIVGESGSGKTTLGLAILGLLDSPPAEIISGSIMYQGEDLLKRSPAKMASIRGTGINMVFQEPLDSLNPVYRVESLIQETINIQNRRRKSEEGQTANNKPSGDASRKLVTDLLRDLCIDKPEEVLKEYPHELSGGMRQRVAISMSLIEHPAVLISDEPTTGLDAYVQNRILGMFSAQRKSGSTLLYITHDLTVASQVCDRIYIMYAGRVMEAGQTSEVLHDPMHPYTSTLVASIPEGYVDAPPLPVQLGEPPNLKDLPNGCKFNPRCPYVKDICVREEPPLVEVAPGRHAACWRADKSSGKYSRN